MAKNNEEKKKESLTKWAESTRDGVAKGIRIYGDVRVSDEDTRDRKVFKNYSSIQARNQRNRLGIGLSRFNQLAGASSFEEYAKMRRQQEEAEGMRSAADKLGGMLTAHQKMFSPNGSRTAKILPAEQEAMDKASERGARIAAGESTFEQEMKAAQAEREAKADPVTVQTPQQAAAEALMRNYGYKKLGNKTVFVTPFSPLPTPTKENTATKASAPFAFDIDPDQYVMDMMAIDRVMGFQAGAKNYQLDPNDPFADMKRRKQVAATGAMMEPTIDAETQKILDTYFGGKLPNMDEFNAKREELYDDVRLTNEETAYFYHRGSELVGNALNAMEQGPPVLDEETQIFLNKYFGGQIPTADEFNEKYEQIYDGTGVGEEYVKAFEEGAESVEKAIKDAQAYESAYGDAMIEYEQALGRLGYDAKDYAGLNSEAGYYARYGLDYNRAAVAQAYLDQYKIPGIMSSYDEHDATMQMIKYRGMDTKYSGTDLETGRTLLQSEMDDETAQTYMYLASEYGEKAAQNYIDAMLKGEYNPRAWQIRDKALRAGTNENWAEASLRSFASVPGQVVGTAYAIEQALKGEKIDPYDTAFMPAQLTQTPRDEVTQMNTRNYGTTDDKGQPVNNAKSYILNALYQAAMSSGDSTLAMLVSGGPHGGMAAAMQGLWAWGGGAQDATMRGGNSAQAALLGGVQALVEMATEAVPMEQLAKAFERKNVKAIKDILLMALHGAISEAPGEGLSELGGALADKAIMDELSNWDATVNEKGVGGAAAQLAGDVLTSMLVGGLSGAGTNTAAASLNYGVGKGVDAYQRYRTNKLLKQAAQDLNEVQQQEQSAARQPAEIPDELATGLEAEYAGAAEEVAENAPGADENAQAEEVEAEEKKPAEARKTGKNTEAFKTAKEARVSADGEEHAVRVLGVVSVNKEGRIMMEVETESGEIENVNAAELSYDDPVIEELMAYGASERMDAKGLRNYLEGYDQSIATPEQYAEAYSSVYSRGRAGVDYDNAALNNSKARQYLSNDAMIEAYAAGENAYNQTHDTVQPAAIETASGNAAAPANVKLSAKEGVKTTKTRGRVSRQYSMAAFSKLGKEGRRNAISQMELLGALASRTGHTIRVVDSLTDKDGKKANAMYDLRTREITVALDATGGAYAYAAAHELTHALRNEHKNEWNGFRDFVRGVLERNGQAWEDLVKYQQDRFGYNREDAEEEVICNTVPAMLKDERNLFELYKGNRTLFDRVVNWVKGLLEDVKKAGQELSSRSQSWAQMDALANDRKALQEIYDRMMAIAEKGAQEESRWTVEEQVTSGVNENVMEAPVDDHGDQIRYSLTTYTQELPKPMSVARAKALDADYTVKKLGDRGKRTVVASGRSITEALLVHEGHSRAVVKKTLDYMDRVAKWFEKAVGRYEYVNLQDVNDASIIIDHNTGEIKFSCQVPNSEYKVNFDFTTVCRQREAVQRFVDELAQERGKQGTKLEDISLTPQNIFKLNTILKNEGYETACLGCFVEAKRYRIKAQADTLVDEWNSLVLKKNPNAEYFGFSTGDTDLMKMSDEEIHKLEAGMRGYSTKGTSKAIDRAERLVELEEMQKLIRTSDIISRQGRQKIREFSPALESFLVSRFGQSGAKPAVGFMPYNSEIAALPDTKNVNGKRMSFRKYLEQLGGARSNSFSDYIPTHMLDYLQRTVDMAARGFTAQCYTKVLARARTFGRTGEKINLSVMFDIDPQMHWAQAGLDKNGEYIVGDKRRADRVEKETGVRPFTQSIPFDEAVELEHDPDYADSVGIIGVGYSYRHIAKMMEDENIPYIIPYHRSSMPDAVARASNTRLATNYEPVQNNTRVTGYAVVQNMEEGDGTPSYATWPEGKKKTKTTDMTYDLNAAVKRSGGSARKAIAEWLGWMQENNLTPVTSTAEAGHGKFDIYASLERTMDPAKTADEYMNYCIDNGLLPVFYEFAGMDGYDKTLFDFSVRNLATGETALQKPVSLDFIDKLSAETMMEMMDQDMAEYNEYNREQFGSEKWERVKEAGYQALQEDEIRYSMRDTDEKPTRMQVEMFEGIIRKIGKETLQSFEAPEGVKVGDHRRAWMKEHGEDFKNAYVEILTDQMGLDAEQVESLASGRAVRQMVLATADYLKTGGKKTEEVIDYSATDKAIEGDVNEEESGKRVEDLFEGAVKSKGIQNGKDLLKFGQMDSEGNELTEEQEKYFANSKIRDKQGRLKVMYHGTANDFTVFNPMLQGGKNGTAEGYGIYFTDTASITDGYGGKRLTGYLNITNPATSNKKTIKRPELVKLIKATCEAEAQKIVDDGDYDSKADALRDTWVSNYENTYGVPMETVYQRVAASIIEANDSDMSIIQEIMSGNAVRDYEDAYKFYEVLKNTMGIDGFVTEWGNAEIPNGKAMIALALDSNQFKNRDNTTPTKNDDIRYSMRDTDENVRTAFASESEAFRQVQAHRITAMEADKIAGEVLRIANSDYDQAKLASEISRTVDYAERGEDVDMRQVDDELTAIAARVLERSRTLDLEHEERAKPVRDYLRTTRMHLTSAQLGEAEKISGSYRAYLQTMFGRVRLGKGGIALDQAWQELSAMEPEWFPADTKEGDMPGLLMQAVDASKPVYHTGMGMNLEESANWLAGQMTQKYFALPAVKAAAKSAQTFGDSVRELKKAMKTFEETSWSEYMNSLQAIKGARDQQNRTQKQKEIAALRAKYNAWREQDNAKRREREEKNRYLSRIEATTNTLLNWMEKPTDAKHVPPGVEDAVRRVLDCMSFKGRNTIAAESISARLKDLADMMQKAQNGELEERSGPVYFEQDQQMIDEIRNVAEMIRNNSEHQGLKDRSVYGLNSAELKQLSKWLNVVKKILTDAGKLRGTDLVEYGSLSEVQAYSIAEMRGKKAYADRKKIVKEYEDLFGMDMLDSFTFFERLGPTATRVFQGLRKGFDENIKKLREAEAFSRKIFEGIDLKKITGKNAPKEQVTLSDGTVLELTHGEMMAIYVLSRREQARGHMYSEQNSEGIIVKRDGKDQDPDPKPLTFKDVQTIAGKLSEDEKRVAEAMQKFLSTECAGWGNETSTKLLGYRKFGEQYYWPIRTDPNTRNTAKLEENYDANIEAILHQGMTKATVKGASNAIVIEDIFDSYTRHISNMAAYSAYAIPLSDFNKWYGSTRLKRSIAKLMGPRGGEYIKNLIMAINGSARGESRTAIERRMATLNRNAKAASVGANLRVAVQQPTSYARAAAYMSPKYLSRALTQKAPDTELIYRWCGIAQWKDWGFRETNVGPNLKELLTGQKTGLAKLQDKAMILAAKGDEWTLKRLWCACELETKDLYGYEVGSEDYYTQVGKRMSELVDRTQVVDSVFHRSQMMRSKSWLAQTLTNFMSEPTKTYNMLYNALYDYAESPRDRDGHRSKAARMRLGRIYGVWVATSVLTAGAAAIMDAFRDDEDEKEWLEKWGNAFWDNTQEMLNPLGMLPGVKEVLSIVQGYSPSRMDLQGIQRIMWAIQAVEKYVKGEGTQNLYGVTYKVAQAASSVTGVPASNLMRDINSVLQTAFGISPTLRETSTEKQRQRVKLIYDAYMAGDKEKAGSRRETMKKRGGVSDKRIDEMLAEFLLDDANVKAAWEAKANGRIADANKARNVLTEKGFPGEAVDKAVQKYGNSVTPKDVKEKDPDEQLNVKLYTSTDARNTVQMILNGSASRADLDAIMSELAADSTAKDPEKSTRSTVQSALKQDYLELVRKGDTRRISELESIMTDVLKTPQSTLNKWRKEAKGK